MRAGDQQVIFAGQRGVEESEVVGGGKQIDRALQVVLQVLAQRLVGLEQGQRRIEGHDAQAQCLAGCMDLISQRQHGERSECLE